LAQGEVKRKGRDVTVVAVGHLVGEAVATAETLIKDNIDVEVWDPRSLLPLDRVGLVDTVKKTGRVILFDDSHRSCGYAAELSSIISETCFRYLKAPIKRITRGDITIPFSEAIEAEVLPNPSHLEQAIRAVLGEE
jgi:pyruvate dehydrogenase E1 component beta subunit